MKRLFSSRLPRRLRFAIRCLTRVAVLVLVATLGVTVAPAVSSAPPAGAPLNRAPEQSGPDSDDAALVSAIRQASVSRSLTRPSLLDTSGGMSTPAVALAAYRFAESVLQRVDPGCRLHWSVLAAIGDVESDHGRHGDATVGNDGVAAPHILGGRLDGDTRWDRAVGPMQFIPSTWQLVGADADSDGVRDPHDIDDAALSAGAYLCAGDGDLTDRGDVRAAVFGYNHSWEYVDLVLRLAAAYADGSEALALPTAQRAGQAVRVPVLSAPVADGAHPMQPPARRVWRAPASDAEAASGAGDGRRVREDRRRGGDGSTDRSSGPRSGTSGNATARPDGSSSRGGTSSGGSTGGDDSTDGTRGSGTSGSGDSGPSGASGSGRHGSGGDGSGGGSTDSGPGDGSTAASGDTRSGGDSDEDADGATGVLDRADDGSWWVSDRQVDLGDEAYLSREALADFDDSGAVEANIDELTTLLGQQVTVGLDEAGAVRALNEMDYR